MRGRVMRMGRGLYGEARFAPGTGREAASRAQAEQAREVLRAQRGRMLHQSGVWEGRLTAAAARPAARPTTA